MFRDTTNGKGQSVANILVTGGAGFIGSHLVDSLVEQGHAVRVLDDLSTGNPHNLQGVRGRFELLQGSVADDEAVRRAMVGREVVYHLAALPSVVKSVEDPLGSHDICAGGTLRVLDAARRVGVRRVVYAGSSSAYGDQPGEKRTEDDALIPLSPYAAAKLAGEHYCTCASVVYGLETVRLRFFNVFGPRQDAKSPYSGVIALFLAAMSRGTAPTIFGDGLQARDFVYVADVVQALTLAAEKPGIGGRVYNVGTGIGTTVLDLAARINELLGTDLQPQHGPARAGDVRFSCADITRIRAELGYAPRVPFAEGLKRTYEWVQGSR